MFFLQVEFMGRDTVVVAKYNEDTSWVLNMTRNHDVFLYNKGQPTSQKNITLPNIGRESHTYLHHIAYSYDSLKIKPNGVTLFTQGRVDDHGYSVARLQELIAEAQQKGFSESVAYVHTDVADIHQPSAEFRIPEHPKGTPLTKNLQDESFKDWFERCVQQRFPDLTHFRWTLGAIFAVRNDRILSRPRRYYEQLLNEFPRNCSNPEVGHFFERSWFYIFNSSRPTYFPKPPPAPSSNCRVLVLQIDDRPIQSVPTDIPVFPAQAHEFKTITCIQNEFAALNPQLNDKLHQTITLPPSSRGSLKRNIVVDIDWKQWIANYHILSHIMNKMVVKEKPTQWSYEFIPSVEVTGRHPSWTKYATVLKHWERIAAQYDVVIVLDTDAWIRDIDAFQQWINYFVSEPTKNFMYSAEPYVPETYALQNMEQQVNGGMTVFKPTPVVRKILQEIFDIPEKHMEYRPFKLDWSFEQICISKHLQDSKEFCQGTIVLPMEYFNTPSGSIVAHCWWKEYIYPMILPELINALLRV